MTILLYDVVPHADHDWLDATKRAVKITTEPHIDKIICISVTRKDEDTNMDGMSDQINISLSATRVDLITGEPVTIGASPIKTALNTHSVSMDTAATDDFDINLWIANLTTGEIEKCLRTEASLAGWALIPTTGAS